MDRYSNSDAQTKNIKFRRLSHKTIIIKVNVVTSIICSFFSVQLKSVEKQI